MYLMSDWIDYPFIASFNKYYMHMIYQIHDNNFEIIKKTCKLPEGICSKKR